MCTYNLSICAVSGDIYGCISPTKKILREFLKFYDHEGASINLTKHENLEFKEIGYDDIYKELEEMKGNP